MPRRVKRIVWHSPPGELAGAHDAARVLTLAPEKLRRPLVDGLRLVPRVGRYYPRAQLYPLSGSGKVPASNLVDALFADGPGRQAALVATREDANVVALWGSDPNVIDRLGANFQRILDLTHRLLKSVLTFNRNTQPIAAFR